MRKENVEGNHRLGLSSQDVSERWLKIVGVLGLLGVAVGVTAPVAVLGYHIWHDGAKSLAQTAAYRATNSQHSP